MTLWGRTLNPHTSRYSLIDNHGSSMSPKKLRTNRLVRVGLVVEGVFFQSLGGEKAKQLLQGWCALEGFRSYTPLHLVIRKCNGNETRV